MCVLFMYYLAKEIEMVASILAVTCRTLKTYIPVYSTSSDYGLSTIKPIEWQRLTLQVEVQIREYLSKGKYYLPTIIKSQV